MISKELLSIVRPRPSDTGGLVYAGGTERDGMILGGKASSPATGETYEIKDGYLDLLKARTGADNIANLANFLPGAGRGYEPLWRVRSLTLLTGEPFPNERELEIIKRLVRPVRGGRYLDLGCSAGLYTRSLSGNLDSGAAVGIDISPSMLEEAVRHAGRIGAHPSFVRTNAKNLPFLDASFTGAVCGGTLNEFGDPARVLRETHRVLEPGGRLAIMGILRAGTPRGRRLQRFLSTGGIRFFEPDELESLLDHAGFEPDPPQAYGPVFFSGATRRG
jgi:SAM-dependent methyltransferase